MFAKFKNLQLVVLTWVVFLLSAKYGRKPFCLNCHHSPEKQGMLVRTVGVLKFIVIALLEIYSARLDWRVLLPCILRSWCTVLTPCIWMLCSDGCSPASDLGGSRFNSHLGFPWSLLGNCRVLPEIRSQPLPHYLKCILHWLSCCLKLYAAAWATDSPTKYTTNQHISHVGSEQGFRETCSFHHVATTYCI
jgi:hypothetical protein